MGVGGNSLPTFLITKLWLHELPSGSESPPSLPNKPRPYFRVGSKYLVVVFIKNLPLPQAIEQSLSLFFLQHGGDSPVKTVLGALSRRAPDPKVRPKDEGGGKKKGFRPPQ